jgi:putative nucleotidyltransferase-like protein
LAQPPEQDLLLRVLSRPATMLELEDSEWDALLPRARVGRLLGRLAAQAIAGDLMDRLPQATQHQFRAATAVATHHANLVRWEVNRIERALAPLTLPILLLKGAAYVAAELPPATGRLVDDVDIMVRARASARCRRRCMRAGGSRSSAILTFSTTIGRGCMSFRPCATGIGAP